MIRPVAIPPANVSGHTPGTDRIPSSRSAIRLPSMSIPVTGNPAWAASHASVTPTYPWPMIAIRASRARIRRRRRAVFFICAVTLPSSASASISPPPLRRTHPSTVAYPLSLSRFSEGHRPPRRVTAPCTEGAPRPRTASPSRSVTSAPSRGTTHATIAVPQSRVRNTDGRGFEQGQGPRRAQPRRHPARSGTRGS